MSQNHNTKIFTVATLPVQVYPDLKESGANTLELTEYCKRLAVRLVAYFNNLAGSMNTPGMTEILRAVIIRDCTGYPKGSDKEPGNRMAWNTGVQSVSAKLNVTAEYCPGRRTHFIDLILESWKDSTGNTIVETVEKVLASKLDDASIWDSIAVHTFRYCTELEAVEVETLDKWILENDVSGTRAAFVLPEHLSTWLNETYDAIMAMYDAEPIEDKKPGAKAVAALVGKLHAAKKDGLIISLKKSGEAEINTPKVSESVSNEVKS